MTEKLSPAEQLAEPTPADVRHRLADDLHSLTGRVHNGAVEWFAADDELRREAQDLYAALASVLIVEPNPALDYTPFSGRRIPGVEGHHRVTGGEPPS